jgi:hypothetical protein
MAGAGLIPIAAREREPVVRTAKSASTGDL